MSTFTAFTTLPDRDAADMLSERIADLVPAPYGTGVFEVEDGSGCYEISGYFLDAPDAIALDLLAIVHGAQPFVISELPETDWVEHVRRELAPVRAGRFFVHGSHDSDKVPGDAIALKIDAAMAFGTGHHATTLGCLIALDDLELAGNVFHDVVDIGCGTAILAMAAAKLWPEPVLASDIDPIAVGTAAANVAINGLEGHVRCVEAAGFDAPALHDGAPFDLIFANILKGPLVALAPDMGRACGVSGFIILSGILNEQADDVIAAYEARGFALHARNELGDWTILVMQRGYP